MRKKKILFVFVAVLVYSCTSNVANQSELSFPYPKVPAMITEPGEIRAYQTEHYWDAYFRAPSGVDTLELQQAVSNFAAILAGVSLENGQDAVSSLFSRLESYRKETNDTLIWNTVNSLVELYFFDPNSPVRDEDLYKAFVQKRALSEFTPEEMRVIYERDAAKCSLNPRESKVTDFSFTDMQGKRHNLYDVKASYTILFFSNPGCNACKEIIDEITGIPGIENQIEEKFIAVVNVYIDEDLEAWRSYAVNYPSDWITGYDHNLVLKGDKVFNIRAIPSLYLLSEDKTVLLKDAPTQKLIDYLYRVQ